MDLPIAGLAAPARRALATAGLDSLDALSQVTDGELLALHGFGPSALPVVRRALEAANLSLRDDAS